METCQPAPNMSGGGWRTVADLEQGGSCGRKELMGSQEGLRDWRHLEPQKSEGAERPSTEVGWKG